MISVDITDEEEMKNAELFMEGIQIILSQFADRMGMEEIAHCFLSVGYDMIHHIAEHSMPGKDPEEYADAVQSYSEKLIETLREEVWLEEKNQ